MNMKIAPKIDVNRNTEMLPKISATRTSLSQIIIGGMSAIGSFITFLYLLTVISQTGNILILPLLAITIYYFVRSIAIIFSLSWAWYAMCTDLVLSALLGLFFLLQGSWGSISGIIISGLFLRWLNSRRILTNFGIRSASKEISQIILFAVVSVITQGILGWAIFSLGVYYSD